jgi:hypothetical protein
MEKKETYKAPEMKSIVLLKGSVLIMTSPGGYHEGGGGSYGNDDTNDNGDY